MRIQQRRRDVTTALLWAGAAALVGWRPAHAEEGGLETTSVRLLKDQSLKSCIDVLPLHLVLPVHLAGRHFFQERGDELIPIALFPSRCERWRAWVLACFVRP